MYLGIDKTKNKRKRSRAIALLCCSPTHPRLALLNVHPAPSRFPLPRPPCRFFLLILLLLVISLPLPPPPSCCFLPRPPPSSCRPSPPSPSSCRPSPPSPSSCRPSPPSPSSCRFPLLLTVFVIVSRPTSSAGSTTAVIPPRFVVCSAVSLGSVGLANRRRSRRGSLRRCRAGLIVRVGVRYGGVVLGSSFASGSLRQRCAVLIVVHFDGVWGMGCHRRRVVL